MSEEHTLETRNGSSWQLPAIIVLGLVALGGLGFGWSASSKLDSTQQAVAAQLKTAEQTMQQDMSSLKDRLAQDEKANTDLQGDLKVVTDKLKITQGQLKKARQETAKLNDETNQKVTALDTSVHSELATKASADEVKTVDTKVVGVRTDLDTTREDLKMAKSEMGTLIARNQFSVAMTVEDKRFLKRNRAMNEPIFFYISGTHIPEELVINKIGKDTVTGYVSIPKANSQVASTGAKSGN